ncbi:hypothetical protein RUND412_003278 [Rhizina undulata]
MAYYGYNEFTGRYGCNGEPSNWASNTSPQLVLRKADEEFLENVIDGNEVAQVSIVLEGELAEAEEEEAARAMGKMKEKKDRWKNLELREGLKNRWEGLRRSVSAAMEKKKKDKGKGKEVVRDCEVDADIEGSFSSREVEFRDVLEILNLVVENGQVFSISPSTKMLVQTFTQILKDIIRNMPNAYDGLVVFLQSYCTQLEQMFVALPPFVQQTIWRTPEKIGNTITAKLFRTAATANPAGEAEAEAQGVGLAFTAAFPMIREPVSAGTLLLALLKTVIGILAGRFQGLLYGVNEIDLAEGKEGPREIRCKKPPTLQSFHPYDDTGALGEAYRKIKEGRQQNLNVTKPVRCVFDKVEAEHIHVIVRRPTPLVAKDVPPVYSEAKDTVSPLPPQTLKSLKHLALSTDPETPTLTKASSAKSGVHTEIDPLLAHELNGHFFKNVPIFHQSYFQNISDSLRVEEVIKKLNSRFNLKKIANKFPNDPQEEKVTKWLNDHVNRHLPEDIRYRYYFSGGNPQDEAGGKSSAILRLVGYVREVFAVQPGRREHFFQVILGYAFMNLAEIGFDPSIKDFSSSINDFSTSINNSSPNTQIPKPSIDIKDVKRTPLNFFLEKLIFLDSSIASRGTTCWSAKNDSGDSFVVKDSWRSNGRISEGELLADAEGVLGVVKCIAYEDVMVNKSPDHVFKNICCGLEHHKGNTVYLGYGSESSNTVTTVGGQQSLRSNKQETLIHDRIHTRLGKPITQFKSIKQLLEAFRDSIKGHRNLMQKKILHRDISINNIMINP